ncbi:type II CAAX prenyl endopeptidase Rce1 family protein [Xanthomonas sp. NCPPB 2632]|uniref:CPBP family glutamic-type intramembrane protease n=1 Tax=Xanthomonas sp. NCPPB 2632 TaxID=3240912 RepID=UPI003519C641
MATVVAAIVMAVALLFIVLPRFAASVVHTAIERDSAVDRAAFARGQSPWAWRFRDAGDVVAGRAFGAGKLSSSTRGVAVQAMAATGFEIGLPLRRDADLARTAVFHLDAEANAPGRYGLTVRQTLDSPGLRAELGTLGPGPLVSTAVRLDRLAWTDERGAAMPAPHRVAMLRLRVQLPVGETLTLRDARLASTDEPAAPALATTGLPTGLTAEALLGWRDEARARDALVIFGDGDTPPRAADAPGADGTASGWKAWLLPSLYLLLLIARHRLRRGSAGPTDALLAVLGPVAFIAGLGLSFHPAPSEVAMFAIGVAYAALLAGQCRLPPWGWPGGWRVAWVPALALPAALVVAAIAGHAPVWPPIGRVLVYLAWATFQQWLILAVVAALLDRVWPRPLAILGAATVFALLHTPNGLLMQLCFVGELGWAWWYLRHRALVPVAVAHALSAVVLQACVSGGALRSLEVSARYLG